MMKAARSILALTLGLGTFAPVMFAATDSTSNPTVFAMTNAADRNEVVVFTRERDGSFSETNRFSTDGRGSSGTNDPLQSQGSLTLNSDHTLLFAANAGSGTLTSFRVERNGQLALVDKAPTGGSEPLAVATFKIVCTCLMERVRAPWWASRLTKADACAQLRTRLPS